MTVKIRGFIKDLNLHWFDIFIIPWALGTVFLVLETNKMIRNVEHYLLSIPFIFHTIFFIISLISIIVFLIFQWRKGIKGNYIFLLGIICLIIFNAFAIFTQEDIIKVTVTFSDTYTRTSTTTISLEAKFVFLYTFILIMSFLYFGFFVLPKRINKLSIVKVAIIIFYLFGLVALIYSLIVDPYIDYIKALFTDISIILHDKDYLPMSFFGNSNTFAFFLQQGIFVSLLHFELTKKKKIFIITAIFYLFLLITICRVGIIITSVLLIVLGVIKLLLWFKKNNKKKAFIWTASSIGALVVISIIVIFGVNPIRNSLFELINHYSMQDRRSIWIASITIIKERPLIFGNGYGVYNSILLDATSFGKWNSTTHNFFLSILGRAGIVGLICFFTVFIYSIVVLIKHIKDKALLFTLLFGIIMFFIHSFLDESYYPSLVNCIIGLVLLNVVDQTDEQAKQ